MDATDYSTVESDAVYYQPPTSGYRQSKSKTAGRSSSSSSASSVSSPSTSRQPSPLSERAPPPLASLSMNLTEPSPNSFPQHSPLVLSSHSRSQIGSSSDSLSIHTLRSNTRYSNQTTYQPKNQHLLNVYKEVYDYFYSKRPIPAELRHRLESIYVTEDEFIKLVVDRECPDGRYISLVDNKIVLDECTNPPHGALIFAIASQIGSQDAAGGHLLIGGTGDHITLTPGTSNKAPDGHWQIDRRKIPPALTNSFPINQRSGQIAPGVVLEVACSNESMPTLTGVDLQRYFAAGTGTRAWIGLKIFCDSRNNPPNHKWWSGWAHRDRAPNGAFLDSATLHPESMPIVATNNAPLANATNPPLTFNLDVAMIIHPMPIPQNYPAILSIDMEEIRELALGLMTQ